MGRVRRRLLHDLAVRANQSHPAFRYDLRTPPELVRLVSTKKIPRPVTIFITVTNGFKQQRSAQTQCFVFRIKGAQISEHRASMRKGKNDRGDLVLKTKAEESKHIFARKFTN